MNVLLDANILCRMAQPGHAHHRAATDATDVLQLRGDIVCLIPQTLYEFWVVATRPTAVNGLGLPVAAVDAEVQRLQSIFPTLYDSMTVFREWLQLVSAHQVSGRSAHDARLVAAMAAHGLTHLLTFNTPDFAPLPRRHRTAPDDGRPAAAIGAVVDLGKGGSGVVMPKRLPTPFFCSGNPAGSGLHEARELLHSFISQADRETAPSRSSDRSETGKARPSGRMALCQS
jgi:predicted nucleic acid-binding protein